HLTIPAWMLNSRAPIPRRQFSHANSGVPWIASRAPSCFAACRILTGASSTVFLRFDGVRAMSHRFCILSQLTFRIFRNIPLVLMLLALTAFEPAKAASQHDADTASLAVDIFVEAGSKAGLPITPQEAEIVKQIVTCGVAGTPVGDCVRNIAV